MGESEMLVHRVGCLSGVESHLLKEEGAHSGRCFNSQTVDLDCTHAPSALQNLCLPFLLSPSFIRRILV